jgi:hypothetical protein
MDRTFPLGRNEKISHSPIWKQTPESPVDSPLFFDEAALVTSGNLVVA